MVKRQNDDDQAGHERDAGADDHPGEDVTSHLIGAEGVLPGGRIELVLDVERPGGVLRVRDEEWPQDGNEKQGNDDRQSDHRERTLTETIERTPLPVAQRKARAAFGLRRCSG